MNKKYLYGMIALAAIFLLVAIFSTANHIFGFYNPNDSVKSTKKTTPSKPKTPDTPVTPDSGSDSTTPTKKGLSAGAIVAIVVPSVIVAGVGGFALVWFVFLKKSWADFLAIFSKK